MAIGPINRVIFDPNARDADSDLVVQEGTPYERPAKPPTPNLSGAVSPKKKRTRSDSAFSASPDIRKRPLRDTRINESHISTGGNLKVSEILDMDIVKRLKTDQEKAGLLGVDSKTFAKMKKEDASIDSFAADRLAINAFGIHPMEIWGENWLVEEVNAPKRLSTPPLALTDKEQQYLQLRSNGLNDSDIAKKMGVSRERARQLRVSALKKRDQQSFLEDDEIEAKYRSQAAADVADAVFLDTGTSPRGLTGRMSGKLPDDHPMFETDPERENREQAFADFLFDKYWSPWEQKFWDDNGKNPEEEDLLDYVQSLDPDNLRDEFERETGVSSWGLEIDEEGNVSISDWADAGFETEEEYERYFDSPMPDIYPSGTYMGDTLPESFDDRLGFTITDWRDSEKYKTYGGTEPLMARNIEQHQQFSDWAKARDWKKFHNEHFDWWAFPIDEPSNTYGAEYQVPEEEVAKLRADKEFLKRLDENLENATSAYGWDIKAGRWIGDDVRDQNQIPQTLSQIRLYKMARSALVFGRCSHFRSLQRMYDNLASFGWYRGQDEGFWAKDFNCSQS